MTGDSPPGEAHEAMDFDAWRRDYDQMTYAEHVEFYRQVAEVYPDQQQFDEAAVRAFLAPVRGNVLEIGGWKGELAAAVLPDFPKITAWLNVDIAPQTVTESVCDDVRYKVIVPDAFIWDADLDLTPYRTVIASHVIEHMKRGDVVKLMERLRHVEHLYIDSPLLPNEPSSWYYVESSHILEIGWNDLSDLITSYGLRKVGSQDAKWGLVQWFAR